MTHLKFVAPISKQGSRTNGKVNRIIWLPDHIVDKLESLGLEEKQQLKIILDTEI